ncbi:hypothetical protein ABAC460_18840 [Asticcacaulis sp. AC460]|uniref:hypothetical protein n=1 Tax=Asticcacaulis sp. AC460 TaxID=1282360 RepID=UPI0003C3B823|nr:hypothetical protein [Asticcacaulis sp. AC460]ESQ87732.1 hypothetical protein ABAC460_18840 [Asticcacaulis sp. AC460]
MRCLKSAAVLLALAVLPVAAHAQDQVLCDALSNIMPGANSGFNGIKGQKTDKNLWAVAVNLPYAHECELRYDKDDKSYSYACYFRVDPSRSAVAEMANYATNINACRPDMVRSGEGEFIELEAPQGQVLLSFNDSYPTEFNVYIEAADQ